MQEFLNLCVTWQAGGWVMGVRLKCLGHEDFGRANIGHAVQIKGWETLHLWIMNSFWIATTSHLVYPSPWRGKSSLVPLVYTFLTIMQCLQRMELEERKTKRGGGAERGENGPQSLIVDCSRPHISFYRISLGSAIFWAMIQHRSFYNPYCAVTLLQSAVASLFIFLFSFFHIR